MFIRSSNTNVHTPVKIKYRRKTCLVGDSLKLFVILIFIIILFVETNQVFNKKVKKIQQLPVHKINQIYYINLDERTDRDDHMLKNVIPLFENVPYKRVSALKGTDDQCVQHLSNPERCRGVAGVIKSNLYILNHLPIVNYTLILEDDFSFTNLTRMERAIEFVPSDWEIIRFDCYIEKGGIPDSFAPMDRNKVFRTMHETKETGWFCGGAYSMLIRPSSIKILNQIWSEKPYDDLDCRLTTAKIKSYCVNQNIMESINLGTNIPKHLPNYRNDDIDRGAGGGTEFNSLEFNSLLSERLAKKNDGGDKHGV